MPLDLPAEQVLPLLESRDPGTGMDARAAWDWLTASGDVPEVTLRDLEYFLWYQLPAKFLTDHAEHRAIALALGDLLDDLGYADGGATCRGPVTMHVLAEWAAGPGRGRRALRKALEESGVEPPDTDDLAWGGIMGTVEATVFHAAASALEDALADGEFTPGTRAWRRAQAEVMRRFLTQPVHWLDERTPQAAVWEERERSWAEGDVPRPLRRAFIHDVRDQIVRPRAAPAGAADRMRPLVRILEVAGAGPSLTQAGYLPPDIVRELVAEFGWEDHRPPRSEADVPRVMTLKEFATEAGFVRRTHHRLRLTGLGRSAAAGPAVLWERVVRGLAASGDFTSAIRELVLVRLLRGAGDRDVVKKEILPILSEAGWRPSGGGELTLEMLSYKLWDAVRPMDLLGMLDIAEWPDRGLRLTEFGADSARAILWHRARAPRASLG